MSVDFLRHRSLALYIAIVCAIGATVAGLVTAATVTGPGTISWPLIAVGFAATELGVIHLRLGRNAFSFTLHEGVLVAAAASATPRDTMLGLLIGTAAVMAGVQRLSPAKVAFNLGQYLLSAAVVVSVLSPLGSDVVQSPHGWLVAFVTTGAVSVGTMTLIAFAIRLAQGMPVLATVKRSFASSLGITFVSTAIGLAVASVAVIEPVRLALLVPLVLVFALGVRSHHRLVVRSDQLELVHGTVRLMAEAAELEPALEVLVSRACTTLTAERAAIVLRARDGSVRQVIVDPDGTRWESSNEEFVTALETATRAGRGAATIDSGSDLFSEVFAITEVDGPARALLAELRVGGRVHGVIAVVQGRGITNAGPEELELLRSLALHAAVVLEATQLATAHASLRERTRVDQQLGLPTVQAIDEAIEVARESGPAPTALLYVSLSDFESVNDLHGFEVGDQLLAAVAGRLRNLARPEDVIARVGGDEFAVFIAGASDPFAIEAFGERVVQQIAIPFRLDGAAEPVVVGARVGVGFSLDGRDDANALIRSAHEHLRRRRLRRHLGVDGF